MAEKILTAFHYRVRVLRLSMSLDGHQLSVVRSQARSMLRVMKSTRPKASQLQEAVWMLLVASQAALAS